MAPRGGASHPIDLGALAFGAGRAGDTALVAGDRALSYGALAREVGALRARLEAHGVAAGDVVALAAERNVETVVAILALLSLRAAYVPLDLAYPRERIVAMLEDARPALMLGTPAALARMPAWDVPHCALMSGGGLDRSASVAEATPPQPSPAAAGEGEQRGEGLAYILFTSGSTGRPKGVAMRRGPLAHLVGWHAAHPRLGRAMRTLQFAPLSFDVHFQELAATFATGGTLVLIDEATRRDPAKLLAFLAAQRIECLYLPYVALHGLAEAARERLPGLALTDVVSAGEQLRVTPAIRALFARLPGCALHNHYGPTETHVVTAATLAGDPAGWPELPAIGAPLPHVEVAYAADGGLLLGGECLAAGYAARPELTAERFVERDGARWYATGDRVERRGDALHYLGRLDQQLKIGGFRVEPAEVELALLAEPEVAAAVAGARALADDMPSLIAWVVPRAPTTAAVLLARLRARLPHWLVPARLALVEALPRTASGKIDIAALPLPEPPRFDDAADPAEILASLWREELGLDAIDPDANLFDAGATSLGVARFVASLRERSRLALDIADVYAAPTLRALAQRAAGAAALAPATRRGARQRDALGAWRVSGARA